MSNVIGATKRDTMQMSAHDAKANNIKASTKMQNIEDYSAKSDVEVKSVRIRHQTRYSNIEDKPPDPFMRYWIFLTNLGQFRIQSSNEGHLVPIFVDTGADCNTITRKVYRTLLDQSLKCAFYPGSGKGMDVNLVGGQRLNI